MRNLFRHSLLILPCALLLCGCEGGTSPPAASQTGQEAQNTAETGNVVAQPGEVSVNKPVIIPPGIGERPLEPGQTESNIMPNGLPVLEAKGVNVDALFADEIDDPDLRIRRLENAFIDFRKEYERLKPSIIGLAAIEEDLQRLMEELNAYTQKQKAAVSESPAQAPFVESAPADNMPQNLNEAPQELVQETETIIPADMQQDDSTTRIIEINPPPQGSQENSEASEEVLDLPDISTPVPTTVTADIENLILLKNIRMGLHPGKVRLVLDLQDSVPYDIDLDNGEKILLLRFSGAAKDPDLAEKMLAANPVLSGYSFQQSEGNLTLIFSLKKETEILSRQILPPDKDYTFHRLVFDLKG